MQLSPQEKLIVNGLNGHQAEWPQPEPCGLSEKLIAVSEIQSTHALLHHQLKNNPAFNTWPTWVRDSLKRESQRLAAVDLIRRQEVTIVLEELGEIGVRPLIFKGAALAHSHYNSPSLRTRNDTDLLILDTDLDSTRRLLEGLGYAQPNAVSGELISYEFQYRKTDKFGELHVLDVHIRINNSQFFAQSMTYDELNVKAVPVPTLGTNARTLSPPHTLMLACMHRASHMRKVAYYNGNCPYYESDLLIWLYDIYLLATSMNDDDWRDIVALSTEKRLRAICLDALQTTVECFHAPVPNDVIMSLSATGKREASAVYLTKNELKIVFAEFMVIPEFRQKLLFLWENIFPSTDYMRQKYRVRSNLWLPVLYLHRAVSGMLKRSRRQNRTNIINS